MTGQTPAAELTPLLVDVKDNLERPLDLRTLADAFGCSPFHFHRLFSGALGETPKRHVERVRLERAAYKLAITNDRVLDVGLSVGFASHETFARAFRRCFGCSPRAYRSACKAAQRERMDRNRNFRGDGCQISDAKFVMVAPAAALAIRRIGPYDDFGPAERNALWDEIEDWARRRGAATSPVRLGLFPDDPTLTPGHLQQADLCIPVDGPVEGGGRIRRLELAGGVYGVIEHWGPEATVGQAYRNLADAIRRSRYVFREDPPIQVFHEPPAGSDPAARRAEVWFPVKRRA